MEMAEAFNRALAEAEAKEEAKKKEITGNLPTVTLERLGGAEEQAQRAGLARELMAQQQAAQRQLAQQQARSGVRGGAAAAQQARFAQQMEAQRGQQEEAGFLGRRQFNIQQQQRERFAQSAQELAQRQLMASLRGQDKQLEAARELRAFQQNQNSGGKIICLELHRQGYLDTNTMKVDEAFGRMMQVNEMPVMIGYWIFAEPVVAVMQKSTLFTKLVWFFAKPWTEHMAFVMGERTKDNFFGRMTMNVGRVLCKTLALFSREVVRG
jgi:hypothetical protein